MSYCSIRELHCGLALQSIKAQLYRLNNLVNIAQWYSIRMQIKRSLVQSQKITMNINCDAHCTCNSYSESIVLDNNDIPQGKDDVPGGSRHDLSLHEVLESSCHGHELLRVTQEEARINSVQAHICLVSDPTMAKGQRKERYDNGRDRKKKHKSKWWKCCKSFNGCLKKCCKRLCKCLKACCKCTCKCCKSTCKCCKSTFKCLYRICKWVVKIHVKAVICLCKAIGKCFRCCYDMIDDILE